MDTINRFMTLFNGLPNAYSIFKPSKSRDRDNKIIGKVAVVNRPVTKEVWTNHVRGVESIGIIPIREDSTCVFGCIDIDDYTIDVVKIMSKIDELRFPLTITKTKSGGVHAWLFIDEPASASLVQDKLRDMAAALGFGRAEIFPKQIEIISSRGDTGSPINMPYFSGIEYGRHAIDSNGNPLDADEFLTLAEIKLCSLKELAEIKIRTAVDLPNGPPCMQHLITLGMPQGTRNISLYNLGVYAKKSNPDLWEKLIEEYNIKYLDPPLVSSEVKDLIKSLKKKDYQYTCKQAPLTNHCNSAVCRGRKFGVGNHSGMPVITGLSKYTSVPPIWFADIEGFGRLELTTEDLQVQRKFQKTCMDYLNSMPALMKEDAWQTMIQNLLDSVNVIQASEDATPKGQLKDMIEKYCTQRAQAMNKKEVMLGKPFTNNGQHTFTMAGLRDYLARHNFKLFGLHEIASFIKEDLRGKHNFYNIAGKGVNTWTIDAFAINPNLETPDEWSDGGPI